MTLPQIFHHLRKYYAAKAAFHGYKNPTRKQVKKSACIYYRQQVLHLYGPKKGS